METKSASRGSSARESAIGQEKSSTHIKQIKLMCCIAPFWSRSIVMQRKSRWSVSAECTLRTHFAARGGPNDLHCSFRTFQERWHWLSRVKFQGPTIVLSGA